MFYIFKKSKPLSQIDEIGSMVDKNDFGIFFVSETWLHEYIKDGEVHIPGY